MPPKVQIIDGKQKGKQGKKQGKKQGRKQGKKQQRQQQQQQKGKQQGKAKQKAQGGKLPKDLDAVGAALRQLVEAQPANELLLAQVPGKYKHMFKEELSPAAHGFDKLKKLVEAVPSHISVSPAAPSFYTAPAPISHSGACRPRSARGTTG